MLLARAGISDPDLTLVTEFRKTNFFFKRKRATAMDAVDEVIG